MSKKLKKKLKKGTIVTWDKITGKIIGTAEVHEKPGYQIEVKGDTDIHFVEASRLKVISKPAKKQEFEDRLETLADAYGIQPTSMVISQITDLGVDMSEERPDQIFKLLMATIEELTKLGKSYNMVPNVLMDSKLTNVLQSVRTIPFEYGAMFFIGVHNAGIKWKREPQDFEFNITALQS